MGLNIWLAGSVCFFFRQIVQTVEPLMISADILSLSLLILSFLVCLLLLFSLSLDYVSFMS